MTTLKSLRESKKLTQDEVAHKAYISNKTYWNIENGLCDPKLSQIIRIASALNIKVEELTIILVKQTNLANTAGSF